MVASVSALTNSAQASTYYEADDYYADGGLSPSQWHGEGAKALGLSGEVDRDKFRALLEGRVSGQQLGTFRDGQLEHRPGWDVTLSAPKSVSIMAEVAGDRRLIIAHGEAVKVAMVHVEKHMAATRKREDRTVHREATDNLVVASFQHGVSRAQDPQLHTHNVIMNATRDENGTWRSLEPRAIYQLQKQIGAIYRQELALKIRELGYEIREAKDSMFEIKAVPEEVLSAFSTRSVQIETALAERGTSRFQASAAEKQIATLDTREAKLTLDQGLLRAGWRETASQAGFGPMDRLETIAQAEARAADPLYRAKIELSAERRALRAVAHAASNLGERESVFSAAALQEDAGRVAMGHVGYSHIAAAVDHSRNQDALIARTFQDRRGAEFEGFTTRKNIEAEARMLWLEAHGRGALSPISTPLAAAKAVATAAMEAERIGYRWNDDQRNATVQLLTSPDRVTGLQGYAGTAKTTTVLATFARELQARGLSITALAPTASAATVLGEALGTRADTVARHLLSPERPPSGQASAWIVDEASLLSARDTTRLFELADRQDARVILVGDVNQLGSVEAGATFAQLQDAGMQTARLAEIVRQTNQSTKDAVLASIEGDAKKALAALDGGGGQIIEHADRADRFAAIAERYASLDKADRERTLIVEPSREGRDTLTADIRAALFKSGALSGPKLTLESLSNKGLTRAEAREPLSYNEGDIVRFTRDYGDKGVARGEAFRVASIDLEKVAISLKAVDGRDVNWRLRQWGAGKVQSFVAQPMEIRTGDQVRFTCNDREAGRVNGLRAEVIALDTEAQIATVQTREGKTETLDLTSTRDRHLAHAYVDTAFAVQGRTADHVILHADSRATNLVDQKSLYVGISRAKETAKIFTNDREKLIAAINERAGVAQTAIDVVMAPSGAAEIDSGLEIG